MVRLQTALTSSTQVARDVPRPQIPDDVATGDIDAAVAVAEHHRPGGVLVAPWRGDGHLDHEAAVEAAARIAERTGALLLEYPVWAWHWAGPGDPRVPWARTRRADLAPEAVRRKREAMAPYEIVLVSPEAAPAATARSLPAEWFDAFYTAGGDDPWGFTHRWYERRKRALTLASLPRERFARAFEPGCSVGLPGVRVERAGVPLDWPEGRFDLVVLSEIGYYCDRDDLDLLCRRAAGSLTAAGVARRTGLLG